MRRLIRLLDRLLRKRQGVFEYWDDPDCMFRASTGRARQTIRLPDGEVPAGAQVLLLHFWNEQMPQIAAEGPDLALARRARRMLIPSLRALARRIQDDPELASGKAVGGATVLFAAGDASGGERLFKRLGFSVFPYQSPLGRFGEFWENLYTWALMWTFNAGSLKKRHLLHLQRTEVWMSTDEFLARYDTQDREAQPSGGAPRHLVEV